MKRGRKPKPYVTTEGEVIPGLLKLDGNRWRITLDGEAKGHRFRANDEKQALSTFERIVRDASPQQPLNFQSSLESEQDKWIAWFVEQLATRPKWLAKKTGIEQLGYLDKIEKPKPSPTLEDVGELYFKSDISDHWRTKSKTIWKQFCDIVQVQTLRDLSQETIAVYKQEVSAIASTLNGSGKTYLKHRFGQIKTIIGFSKTLGLWAEDRTKALAYCTILTVKNVTTILPNPIDPKDYKALVNGCESKDFKAMLLIAMNCCMYGKEVCDITPESIDLKAKTLLMIRNKTKVVRIAVLWNETVEALAALPKRQGFLFKTDNGHQHTSNTVVQHFAKLRRKIGKPKITFNQIRDGAYTAAINAKGVEENHAKALAGHRNGMSDLYAARRPTLVADACEAIRKVYR